MATVRAIGEALQQGQLIGQPGVKTLGYLQPSLRDWPLKGGNL
jgi:hypothetical protein